MQGRGLCTFHLRQDIITAAGHHSKQQVYDSGQKVSKMRGHNLEEDTHQVNE